MLDLYRRLLSCTVDSLPQRVQDVYLSRPVVVAPVEASGQGFRLRFPRELARPAPQALVPKLGIKSWREAGGLGVIYQGVPMLAVVVPLLQAPTPAQQLMARAWQRAGVGLNVYLSPYVDFSDISEARYWVRHGVYRQVSVCLRGRSADRFQPNASRMARAVETIAQVLDPASWIIDLALLPNETIRVVEINPGLTPREVDELATV